MASDSPRSAAAASSITSRGRCDRDMLRGSSREGIHVRALVEIQRLLMGKQAHDLPYISEPWGALTVRGPFLSCGGWIL